MSEQLNLSADEIVRRLDAQNYLYYLMHKDDLPQPSQQLPAVIDPIITQRWTVEEMDREAQWQSNNT